MFCSQCGKQIDDGVKFCEFCGAMQAVAPSAGQPQAVQPQPAVQPQAAVQPQVVKPQPTVQPQQVQPQGAAVYTTVQPQVQPQPQVVYVQQGVQPQAAPQPAQSAPKKKKPPVALFVILGILLSLALIAVIVIVIVVVIGVNVGKYAKDKVSDYANTQIESLKEDVMDEFDPFSEDVISDFGTITPGDGTESGKKEDGPSGEDIGQYGDGDIGQFDGGPVSWDGVGRPSFDDFSWYAAGELGNSDGVTWLDASEYQGRWKGLILYPSGDEELVNFDIEITPDKVTLLADWYMVQIGGNELMPEEDMEDTLFTGYEWGNGIHVEGTATVEINEFWERGGTQYGMGTMVTADGSVSDILLVRP